MSNISLSVQLMQMEARAVEAEAKLEEANKTAAALKTSKEYSDKAAVAAKSEIDQLHAVLDILPGAPGRKTENEESWQRIDINIVTRFAGFLAYRSVQR